MEKNRSIVTKLEILNDELLAIHALEIINNEITGVYFHAYSKINFSKFNDMYYLAKNQNFCENIVKSFQDFVGYSKLITFNGEYEKIKNYFPNNFHHENIIIKKDLFNIGREEGIKINRKTRHGGLIDCTIFARILFEKYLVTKEKINMTGIFKKRKYYK